MFIYHLKMGYRSYKWINNENMEGLKLNITKPTYTCYWRFRKNSLRSLFFWVLDSSDDVSKATKMKETFSRFNGLQQVVESLRLDTRSAFEKNITAESLPDFPKLSIEELRDSTFGVYQILVLNLLTYIKHICYI